MIISIGRECGSGGHEIGEKLAAMYGLKLYDKNLIGAIAAHTGKDADYLVKLEEKVKSGILPVHRDGFAAHRHELMSSCLCAAKPSLWTGRIPLFTFSSSFTR